jgi:hypothetical protein
VSVAPYRLLRCARAWGSGHAVIQSRHLRRLGGATFAASALLAVAACDWSHALDSDPQAWSPAATPQGDPRAPTPVDRDAEADVVVPGACNGEPPFDPELKQSSAGAISHRAGQPCLEGCHEAGGSARSVLAVGGTIHRAEGERVPVAGGGTVNSVGGTTLNVDQCGNFYAVASALRSPPQLTQPFVQNPILRRMEKPLFREAYAGSCNRAGCHDFSSSSKSGIYY